jgi:multidrug efflux pump subunit AcrB
VGQSFNLMTLGGLAAAVGLVIDDKIVVVENIVLHRDAGQGPLEATASALKELTVPLIGSTLTPIVVFLPLITITGVTGTFFSALAIAMSVALLTSLVLALVWTSNLGTRLIRRHGAHHEDTEHGFFGHIIRFYERWLRRLLHHPTLLAAFCILLILVSYASYRQLGSGLLPAMDEGGFILDYNMPPGSSLQETNRVLNHVERIIRETPEVESTSRRTGLQLGIFPVTEPNTGDFTVKLKDRRKRGIDDVIAEIRDKVKKSEPVLDVEFVQLLQDMIGDLSGGAPEPIAVKLFSDRPDVLKEWAPHVGDALMNIAIGTKKPIVDIEDGIENTTSGPAVTFNVSPERLARAGFAADDLEIVTSAIMDGEPTSQPVIVNERPYTLRIRYPASSRSSLEAVSNTLLVNSSGATATLGSLTGITEEPGQTEVLRENLQRVVTVTARLEGIDLGTAITAVQKTVADLKLPPSIRVEYGGIYAEQQKSFRDLVTVLILAIVLIFLVLLFEFRSYSAPIAILSSAVLSTSGVCFALLITRTEFNVSSFMGLIMVVGIVAKNGILLLDANHKYLDAGMSAEEAMVQAGRRRLRPIVMTAMAAVAGMLPLALAIGAGSQMLQPLAIAVIGGIMISMVLSLIITPAIQFYLTRHESAAD